MANPQSQRILVAFHIPEALRDVLAGITRFAKEHRRNWQILCVNADEFDANFGVKRCHGAIVQVREDARRMIGRLQRSPIPVVNLLRDLHPRLPSVLSDDPAIGRAGAEYLMSLGFKKLAFVSLDTPWSRRRELGFMEAVRDAGLPPPITTESLGVKDFRFMSRLAGQKALGRWARKLGPRSAVMAPSDFVARTLLAAAQAEGIDIPSDIAILGVDNFLTLCELSPVPLSSIAQDFSRMGFESARLLDQLMTTRQSAKPETILIPPGRLHARASTDAIAFEDPIIAQSLRAIREHGATGIRMSDLLRQTPLSRRWFDHRFKALIGHTPAEEIRRCRLRHARDLLIDTELPLRQISSLCGFSFPENLMRSFREIYEMSPSAYRLKHRAIRG